MRRIPRQRDPPPSTLPLDTRPLRQPLAPQLLIPRQRKKRRAKRFRKLIRIQIPNLSDFLRRGQPLCAALVTNRQRGRPGPRFR